MLIRERMVLRDRGGLKTAGRANVSLSDNLLNELRRGAAKKGVSINLYARDILERYLKKRARLDKVPTDPKQHQRASKINDMRNTRDVALDPAE
jgi:hypothetical protein